MKKNYIYISVLILICFFLCLLYIFSFLKFKNEAQEYNNRIYQLELRVLLQSSYSGFLKFPEDFKLQIFNGNSSFITDVVSDLTVVLYISSLFCESCVEDAIEKIETSGKNYIIISNGFSLRELMLIKKEKRINAPIFSIINNNIPFINRIEKASYPFYFTVSKDLEVSNIFFPIKSSSSLEDKYFEQF